MRYIHLNYKSQKEKKNSAKAGKVIKYKKNYKAI